MPDAYGDRFVLDILERKPDLTRCIGSLVHIDMGILAGPAVPNVHLCANDDCSFIIEHAEDADEKIPGNDTWADAPRAADYNSMLGLYGGRECVGDQSRQAVVL